MSTGPTRQLHMIKLSAIPITQTEIQVLSRRLSFCTLENFDLFEVVTDLQHFVRKLLLKWTYTKTNIEIDTTDWSQYSMSAFKALWDLTLFQKNNTVD